MTKLNSINRKNVKDLWYWLQELFLSCFMSINCLFSFYIECFLCQELSGITYGNTYLPVSKLENCKCEVYSLLLL